jgi:hypothetical protein
VETKKEKLLVVRAPEETKPKCLYKNFTDICSKLPSSSPGTILEKKQYIQQKVCVSRQSAKVRAHAIGRAINQSEESSEWRQRMWRGCSMGSQEIESVPDQ